MSDTDTEHALIIRILGPRHVGDGTRDIPLDSVEFPPYVGRRRAPDGDADTELVPAVQAAPDVSLERLLESGDHQPATGVEDEGPPGQDEPSPRRDWATRLRVLIGRWLPWA